jgi:hypothetical protein
MEMVCNYGADRRADGARQTTGSGGRKEDVGTHNLPANYTMNANAMNCLIRHRDTAVKNLKDARAKLPPPPPTRTPTTCPMCLPASPSMRVSCLS